MHVNSRRFLIMIFRLYSIVLNTLRRQMLMSPQQATVTVRSWKGCTNSFKPP